MKPWTVRELSDEESSEIGWQNLPGRPYDWDEELYRNFVVEHEDFGYIGKADIHVCPDYHHLRGAEIPEKRGLSYKGDTPFGDLIEARLNAVEEGPVNTSTTTEHGKSQYKHAQYGATPTLVDHFPSTQLPPHIDMWFDEFGETIFHVPDQLEETIEKISEGVLEPVFETGSDPSGLDYSTIKQFPNVEDGMVIYNLELGDKNPRTVASEIISEHQESSAYVSHVSANPALDGVAEVSELLYEEGYDVLGITPPLGIDQTAELRMGKLEEDVNNVFATDETLELINNLDLDHRIDSEGEKSSEITLLS